MPAELLSELELMNVQRMFQFIWHYCIQKKSKDFRTDWVTNRLVEQKEITDATLADNWHYLAIRSSDMS